MSDIGAEPFTAAVGSVVQTAMALGWDCVTVSVQIEVDRVSYVFPGRLRSLPVWTARVKLQGPGGRQEAVAARTAEGPLSALILAGGEVRQLPATRTEGEQPVEAK